MNIQGNGAPSKSTVGAIGDQYTDSLTGTVYECAYIINTQKYNDTDIEYVWEKVNDDESSELEADHLNHIEEGISQLSSENAELKGDLVNLNDVINTNKFTIGIERLEFVSTGYMRYNGEIFSENKSHAVYKTSCKYVRKVEILPLTGSSNLPFIVIKDSENNVKTTLYGDTSNTLFSLDFEILGITDEDTMYINWFDYNSTKQYLNQITLYQYANTSISRDVDTLYRVLNGSYSFDFNTDLIHKNGYMDSNGDITSSSSNAVLLPIINKKSLIKALSFTSGTAFDSYPTIIIKDRNGTIKNLFFATSTSELIFDVSLNDDDEIYINWFNYKTSEKAYVNSLKVIYRTIDNVEKSEDVEIKYSSCLNKPFSFNGKTAYFFGDSITRGFTSGSTTTQNGYPKLFSDSVGMTYTNYGVGGSLLSKLDDYGCIFDAIKNTNLNSDFVFVAGGINDWQCGVNEDTLKQAVTNICVYLKSNYTGNVIFITPINHGGRNPIVTPTQTVQNVRNVITRVALKYDYSVVQGNEIPFPIETDNTTYISEMYGDKLHPTELGYKVYARSLRTILC